MDHLAMLSIDAPSCQVKAQPLSTRILPQSVVYTRLFSREEGKMEAAQCALLKEEVKPEGPMPAGTRVPPEPMP